MIEALGCHVFAGGFTMGALKVPGVTVRRQLEIHDLGAQTARSLGVEYLRRPSWGGWPLPGVAQILYGNPRCTGFSSLTGGLSADVHGPCAKCTQDIVDLCSYGHHNKIPVIIFESVQQA